MFVEWTKEYNSLKESEEKQRTGRLQETGVLEAKGGEILEEMRSIHLTNRKLF